MKPPTAPQSALLDGRWLSYALFYVCASAWAATAVLLARGAVALPASLEIAAALAAVAVFAALLCLRGRWAPAAYRIARWMAARSGLLSALLTGVALRLAWAFAFPSQPVSDGRTYLELAGKLVAGGAYETAETLAYWPPGYAFFLSAFLRVLPVEWVLLCSQLLVFALALAGVHRLSRTLATPAAANVAALLFALWPNLVAHSGTADKETLVIALLVWAGVCAMSPRRALLFCAGLLLGAATLVQPSAQLLIPAAAVLLLLRAGWRGAGGAAILVLGAALALTPWALRNYQALGAFKLVSTNGGWNLYRANNPLANGGYTPRGEVDLSHLGELELDSTAGRLALQWIRDHPVAFFRLGVEKQARFMGDDAGGVASTFRWQGERRDNRLYFAVKLLSNLWWLFAWLLLAALLLDGARLHAVGLLILGWWYFFALHTVFESGGKYHEPVLWIPCVLLGILLMEQGLPEREGGRA
ncbi:glycosyltransferase family 39 protein [Janthinobacterium fluminis]|uniref:Glycosyltransferase family 39 protein n=1 Tax=Janthinobacterium fluminis TaxID=2987524 RepID=A0ABT5JY78_9BURK|nr:glycosyltransferase family 39 protein [Janthinobacterium fluminis]MDC8757687.1 glycosyltransferase family 39 protein [Janthinobacterium fluminis]